MITVLSLFSLYFLGKGAWTKWLYEVELQFVPSDEENSRIVQVIETMNTTHTLFSLVPSSKYYVRVRAKSEYGIGPWSSYFEGKKNFSKSN